MPAVIAGVLVSGITGAAAAQVFVAAGVMLPLYVFLFARAGLHPRRLLARIWLPAVIAASVGLSALGISELLPANLLACILAGIVTAVALAGLIFRDRDELSRLRGGNWVAS